MRRAIWVNFVVSVWLLIATCVVEAIVMVTNWIEIDETWGPFAGRVVARPFIVAAMEVILWFMPYREGRQGARIMAAFMGIALLLTTNLTHLLIADLYDMAINWPRWWLYFYVAGSHIAFAIAGRGRRRRASVRQWRVYHTEDELKSPRGL